MKYSGIKSDLSNAVEQVPRLVHSLYSIVAELEKLFAETGKKFTPDGHLVGSLGEVIAAHMYDLVLLKNSEQLHDAETESGVKIQIKATQGNRGVALRGQPQHLIVLQLNQHGDATEIFNGPGAIAWERCGNRQGNGQSSVSLSTLRSLMQHIPESQRVPLKS